MLLIFLYYQFEKEKPAGLWFRRKAAVELGILWRNWRLRRGYSLVSLASLAGVSPTKVSPYLLVFYILLQPEYPILLHTTLHGILLSDSKV